MRRCDNGERDGRRHPGAARDRAPLRHVMVRARPRQLTSGGLHHRARVAGDRSHAAGTRRSVAPRRSLFSALLCITTLCPPKKRPPFYFSNNSVKN